MQLKRKIFHKCRGNKRIQKAVSLALLLKLRLGRTSTLRNWSVNKLHEVTGASASTINKYLPLMRTLGLIHHEGKNDRNLVVKKLSSKHIGRNIDISRFNFSSFKDIYNCLRAFLALAIQARKDFIKHVLHAAHNPSSYKEMQSARSMLRRLVKDGAIRGMDSKYEDHGIGRKRIADETGVCLRTAHRIINFAVNRKWWKKINHRERWIVRDVGFNNTGEMFTYATRDTLVIYHANRYNLNHSLYKDIYPLGTFCV